MQKPLHFKDYFKSDNKSLAIKIYIFFCNFLFIVLFSNYSGDTNKNGTT